MTAPDFDFGYYSVCFEAEGGSRSWGIILPNQRNGSHDRHLLKPGAYMVQLVVDGRFGAYIRWRPDGETAYEICKLAANANTPQQFSTLVPIIATDAADIAVRFWGGNGTPRRAAVRVFADPVFTP
ncbi:hypothetical protein [Corynebacterium riegelii]|uniref:hypothetical protein n=1 Tax=Corynebacterium riegelii TaxID=156976 RepID=UPI002889CE9C|nr:hypothetical protein [Corynebacterium riegelii]